MPRRRKSEAGFGRLVALASATAFVAGITAGGLTVWTLAPDIAPAAGRALGSLRHMTGLLDQAPPPAASPARETPVLLLGGPPQEKEPPAALVPAVEAGPAAPQGEPPLIEAAPAGLAPTLQMASLEPSSEPLSGLPQPPLAASTPPAPEEPGAEPAPPASLGEAALEAIDGEQPATDEAAAEKDGAGQVVVVRRGDTLLDILTRMGVARSEAHEVVSSLRGHYDPRRLKIGQALEIGLADAQSEGAIRLASLSLNVDFENDLRLRRDESGVFTAETVERDLVREQAYATSPIDSSLYEAARAAEVPLETLHEIIKLFSWDVDFQRDVQPGDRFELVYDRLSLGDGGEARGAGVRFAALHLGDRAITAYRFEREDGSADYYDADGRPLRKWLMKTPIDGARLSSTFGPRRHPVLGYTRMHKGTDFAAPTGTPIYAAGDGVVEFAGRNKGYGNYVRIRHNETYSTAYAHMSRFAKDTRRGARVRQGEVIGYVGTTGLSTGPHLHYEVLKSGTQVNPQSVEQVVADPLKGRELKRFVALRASVDATRAGGGQQLVAEKK
ncbi:peptidoglycan DD-metalloendopeptidase family protein [Geminicoccaceae bacterium 1502E]|nr:peptidoglycan DD-metalloendopeptidase family protein [Geminicoccaceae bacterium 1502E]